MGKRLKLRISRVFTSCRPKDPYSTFPTTHIPPSSNRPSSFKRHLSSAFLCRCAATSGNTSDDDYYFTTTPQLDFHRQKHQQEWNVVITHDDELSSPRQKIYTSSVSGTDSDDPDILAPTLPELTSNRQPRKKKTTRFSTSSADSCLFSSEEREVVKEETEALVSSSRSFSDDSSVSLETIREKPPKRRRRRRQRAVSSATSGSESPARLSVLKRVMRMTCKVKESYAVVKKSADPYEDFKRSMMEMILEKGIYNEKELEQLLHCFLSLNSRQHHGIIVQAFADIWNAVFSTAAATN